MTRTTLTTLASLGLSAGLAISLGGCKKPPPPPPQGACCHEDGTCTGPMIQTECVGQWRNGGACEPNPCPQPVKPDVSLESVAQNEHADPRVQFAADIKLPEDRVDLAKAIVHLADAVAKGDAKAMKSMLTRRPQNLLADLQNSGGWEEGTKQIEAVRIVLIRDGVDFGAVGSAKIPEGEVTGSLMGKLTELANAIPDEQKAAIMKAAQEAMAGMDPAALAKDPSKIAEFQAKVTEAMKAAGVSEEVQQKLAELAKPADAAPAPAPGASSIGTGVLMAIQDIHGAYVLGWQAEKVGDTWAFTNAPATPDVRPRASLWDNVGPEAFQAIQLASAAPASRSGGDDAPGKSGSNSGGGGEGGGGSGGGGGGGGSGGGGGGSPVPEVPSSPFGKHPHH